MNPVSTTFNVRTDDGFYDLEASVRIIGNDILIAVWGGDTPHIGAVSAAQAQPSIVNPEKENATASVICFPGHKEDHLVKLIAEKIALSTGSNVVVTAGTHWDNIDKGGIEKVMENSTLLTKLIIEKLPKTLAETY
ncbi:MAG TPA: hypothetical protein QGF08_05775 [Candidatus Marinimicrobia bacterium]|jgi:hypothetical protein|nr:hypothetical protein [Candidatus Neomarinimicrobiota bacterium]MDP6276811.1 hypothetical protein [Candidatus Neomarinimicrobiota bacterium]MDP7217698.1 hypothetical protein [Candidatus Neomarinimicrobiota bacterium]MDP7437680.1 hypothetical protein [Candidatus Neomarinimicrobiota bacterium]HBN44919.1 hypothetical protein [Candidatus Neomarinimicrobiota bacterium]|tara:strand:+ start:576 stop:983 length:408 start_codon:yes stop_codon:yes gene_type:complete